MGEPFVVAHIMPDCATEAAVPGCGSRRDDDARCNKVIIRSRLAQTPWEKLCRAVVGEPVHMDVVLAKPMSSSQRFCFSSYMKQEFEMCLMDEAQMKDPYFLNQSIDITDAEYDRCMKFMLELVDRKTKYDYVDALVLMPMAPKGKSTAVKFASAVSPILQDVDSNVVPKKVFCSQSVVLMLRECLDSHGLHGTVVEQLKQLNSRLVSPKMVYDILDQHPFTETITNAQLMRLVQAWEPAQPSR